MKIRLDFVTNSSSSSFIIAYDDEQDLKESIEKQIWDISDDMEDNHFFIETLLNDIENHPIDFEELESIVREEYDNKSYYAWCKHVGFDRMFEESPEHDAFVKDFIETNTQNVMNLLKGHKHFAKFSYSDNDGEGFSQLEHYITPTLKECKVAFNHH